MRRILALLTRLVSFFFGWLPVYGRRERLVGDGKRVLVSGCDSGIGLRLAQRLHEAGYRVLAGCLSTDSDGARQLSKLRDGEYPVRVLQLDVTSDRSVHRALIQGQVHDEGLWGLVNNAGVCVLGEFEGLEDSEKMVENVAVCDLSILSFLVGRVVSLSTVVAAAPAMPCMSTYCVSKTAVESFSRCLRLELARHGAHASVVRPGDLAKHTGIMKRQADDNKAMWESMDEEQRSVHGPHVSGFVRGWKSQQGALSPPQLGDSPVFDHIEHALGSRRPRALYVSDSGLWPLFLRTLSVLPTAFSDAVSSLLYNFLRRLGSEGRTSD
ncbi:hypothetical protein HPB52_017658 [Rhipicephalus sanguineus]|uniref:Uncharacterized protein n=1 Tax=Rhipicephalus sanguineus TaxID=34632 RepID=A0A9D4QB69_RHISA|nr:hypothetical protein HPB52_017658 [Rhipicephalus sanguineus]